MSAATINKIGLRNSFSFGSIGLFCFIAAQILPAWSSEYHRDNSTRFIDFLQNKITLKVVLTIAAMLSGFGSTLLWVAQGEYLAKCSTE